MQEKYSNIITDFLREHVLISVKGLEENLSLPDGTIRQALVGGRLIPEKHIYRILCELAKYGLEIQGYRLTYDPVDNSLSAAKWVKNVKTIEKKSKDGNYFEYIVKEARWMANDYFDLS